jgi:hypothetical protein
MLAMIGVIAYLCGEVHDYIVLSSRGGVYRRHAQIGEVSGSTPVTVSNNHNRIFS